MKGKNNVSVNIFLQRVPYTWARQGRRHSKKKGPFDAKVD